MTLNIPAGAQILHVASQAVPSPLLDKEREQVCLWALVDPLVRTEPRRFRFTGTGHIINESQARFVGTVIMFNGSLVFHIFEVPNE